MTLQEAEAWWLEYLKGHRDELGTVLSRLESLTPHLADKSRKQQYESEIASLRDIIKKLEKEIAKRQVS